MATALNVFRTVTSNLFTTPNVLYTTPYNITSIILSVKVTNLSSNVVGTTFYHTSAMGANTFLVQNFQVPYNDAAAIVAGKLVLETGQSISGSASQNGSLQIIVSLLETANN